MKMPLGGPEKTQDTVDPSKEATKEAAMEGTENIEFNSVKFEGSDDPNQTESNDDPEKNYSEKAQQIMTKLNNVGKTMGEVFKDADNRIQINADTIITNLKRNRGTGEIDNESIKNFCNTIGITQEEFDKLGNGSSTIPIKIKVDTNGSMNITIMQDNVTMGTDQNGKQIAKHHYTPAQIIDHTRPGAPSQSTGDYPTKDRTHTFNLNTL